MQIQNTNFIVILQDTPVYISNIYYEMIKQGIYRTPRKSSVLKYFKENLRYLSGYDYNTLSKEQQQELISMAEDAYDGIREYD